MKYKNKVFWFGFLLVSSMGNIVMAAAVTPSSATPSNLPKGKPMPKAKKQSVPIVVPQAAVVADTPGTYNPDGATVRLAHFLQETLIRPYNFQADASQLQTAVTVPAGSTVAELLLVFALLFPTSTYQQRQQAGHAMKILMMSLRSTSASDAKLLDLDTKQYNYYFGLSTIKDSNKYDKIMCGQFGCINTISLLQEVVRIQARIPALFAAQHPVLKQHEHLFSQPVTDVSF